MTDGKKDILIITGRYLPGYKDGGPVRTIKNLTDWLGDEYSFRILTCDRDHGDVESYTNITVNDWNQVGRALVWYVPPGGFSSSIIQKLVEECDLVFITGCFSDYSIKALILNRLGLIKKQVVIAPMGLFMPNAMKRKPFKYNSFLLAFKAFGAFKNIIWSVSSEDEKKCVKRVISSKAICCIASDLPRKVKEHTVKKTKRPGELRVFFISRISPEKNIIQSIDILKQCHSSIWFTIYGPILNQQYWEKVEEKLLELPSNIHAAYKGNIDSEQVVETLEQEHVFLFTTIGENFSHVVHEALSAGCPCVISDQTPWQDLDKNCAGHVLPLNDNSRFVKAIESYAEMAETEFQKISDAAHDYARRVSRESAETTGYRDLFEGIGQSRRTEKPSRAINNTIS